MIAGSSHAGPAGCLPPRPRSRCRYVVQQHFVLDRKQLAATVRQMCLEGSLVRKEMIEAAVKGDLCRPSIPKLQQIGKRRALKSILGTVYRSMARRACTSPARPPSSPMQRAPFQSAEAAPTASSRPVPRHNVSAVTSPNRRERSTRTPFRRTGTVKCSLPSSNSGVCSAVPISWRASPRASTRPCSSRSPRCATVCWMTRRPIRTLRTKHQ